MSLFGYCCVLFYLNLNILLSHRWTSCWNIHLHVLLLLHHILVLLYKLLWHLLLVLTINLTRIILIHHLILHHSLLLHHLLLCKHKLFLWFVLNWNCLSYKWLLVTIRVLFLLLHHLLVKLHHLSKLAWISNRELIKVFRFTLLVTLVSWCSFRTCLG